jgi:hypothetical protein
VKIHQFEESISQLFGYRKLSVTVNRTDMLVFLFLFMYTCLLSGIEEEMQILLLNLLIHWCMEYFCNICSA